MNRTKGILAAGTFTGLVLITVLAMGFGNLGAKAGEDATVTPSSVAVSLSQTGDMTTEEALQQWQDYSGELEQTIRTMQERETVYRQQLEAANQTILQLQDQINNSNRNSVPFFFDNGRSEHEENEHEEQFFLFGQGSD